MNKVYLKKFLLKVFLIILIFCSISLGLITLTQNLINANINQKMSAIVAKIEEKYPLITEEEIMDIINSEEVNNNLFLKYGITLEDNLVKTNANVYQVFSILNIINLLLLGSSLIYLFLRYEKRINREIKKITKYLHALNKQIFNLELDSYTEDELSILKNEIYKITIMLKEKNLNLGQDKKHLKESLEDISHQLKTPLTSMTIMLDNLLDEEKDKQKQEFLHDIKREVNNLNFLVQYLLKLARFDAQAITLKKEKINVNKLLKEVKQNLSALSDLKNIKINIKGNQDVSFQGDFYWEKEALTNILKNALDYSNINQKVNITYTENKVYTLVTLENYKVMAKEDVAHVFERFYKGSNSSIESAGIGLALAKTIIEKDNGSIKVETTDKSTKFMIKYFKL